MESLMLDLLEQLQHLLEEYPTSSKAVIGLGALAVSAGCGYLYDWYYAPEKSAENNTQPNDKHQPRKPRLG